MTLKLIGLINWPLKVTFFLFLGKTKGIQARHRQFLGGSGGPAEPTRKAQAVAGR